MRQRITKALRFLCVRDRVTTVVEVCGAVLIAFGVGMLCLAAGVITAGVLAVLLGRMFAEAP